MEKTSNNIDSSKSPSLAGVGEQLGKIKFFMAAGIRYKLLRHRNDEYGFSKI